MNSHFSHLMPTYARFPLTLVEGRGTRVRDDAGREYLDFVSGIAVNALGHAHPALAEAIAGQAGKMLHCSNLFHVPQQEALATKLCELSGLGGAFFSNSGAEANEAAIKLARKCWHDRNSPRHKIISAMQSFHGRTLTTLTATGQEKVKTGFSPLPPGFLHVPFGDIEALKVACDDETAAIMLEPIQGEGGVNAAAADYLQAVRALCDKNGALLILDEIQTGIGRTGTMFAFEQAGIRPDILTLAKGLGGGVPIGAMLADAAITIHFGPGSHGSTFGGNPLSCTAALTVLHVIEEEKLLANITERSAQLFAGLESLQSKHALITGLRGTGLLVGIKCDREVAPIVAAARECGLLLLSAGPDVLRLLPPLNVSAAEIDEAIDKLDEALSSLPASTGEN